MKPLAPFGVAPKPHPLMRGLGALVLAFCASSAPALEIGFPPGAERTAQRIEALGSHALPIGPWADGAMLTQRVEGRVDQSAWRIPGASVQGTLALLAPLRAALLADGWQLLFECETLSCGGFDFRYSTQVLPEPAMHVDLGDFRFLSARRGRGEEREHLSLLVSRSAGAGTGHVQMIRIGPAGPVPPAAAPAPPPPVVPAETGRLAAALDNGSAVLDGVTFASGDAATVQGGDAALAELAAWLAANPDRTIALVGHTDASGSLEANVALSRQRAEAVRARLIADHGADGARISALGAGFMAPRASNLTEDGRAKNRRVEAIVTSTR